MTNTTKKDYTKTLNKLHNDAMVSNNIKSSVKEQRPRVACVVAVTTLKDELEKQLGEVPLEALIACSEFMKKY